MQYHNIKPWWFFKNDLNVLFCVNHSRNKDVYKAFLGNRKLFLLCMFSLWPLKSWSISSKWIISKTTLQTRKAGHMIITEGSWRCILQKFYTLLKSKSPRTCNSHMTTVISQEMSSDRIVLPFQGSAFASKTNMAK